VPDTLSLNNIIVIAAAMYGNLVNIIMVTVMRDSGHAWCASQCNQQPVD